MAKLQEPDLVEALAAAPEPDEQEMPLDGWDQYLARMANIEDLLTRILYATLHTDPSAAPSAPRPEMPYVKRRKEIQSQRKDAKRRHVEMQLIPGGVDG